MADCTWPEPPESLLTSLARPGAPRPWLTLFDGLGSLVTDAASMHRLTSGGVAPLPVGEPIHVVGFGSGNQTSELRLRFFSDWCKLVATPPLIQLEGSDGAAAGVSFDPTRDDPCLTMDGARSVTVSGPWFEIGISADGKISVQSPSNAQRQIGTVAGLQRIVVPEASTDGDDDTNPPEIYVKGASPGARHVAIAHTAAAIHRLRDLLPPGAVASVVAARKQTRPTPELPTGDLEILGFLSENWTARLACGDWDFVRTDGTPVDPACLPDYGRGGGLVTYVYDRRWGLPAATDGLLPADAEMIEAPEPQFAGARDDWMVRLRCAEFVLYQLATVWYLRDQGKLDDPGALQALETTLVDSWHPAFGRHVDVVGVAARAMGRFRYSDRGYLDRANPVMEALTRHLAAGGVASSALVLS